MASDGHTKALGEFAFDGALNPLSLRTNKGPPRGFPPRPPGAGQDIYPGAFAGVLSWILALNTFSFISLISSRTDSLYDQ